MYAYSKQVVPLYRLIYLGKLDKSDVNRELGYAQKVLIKEKLIQSVKPSSKPET